MSSVDPDPFLDGYGGSGGCGWMVPGKPGDEEETDATAAKVIVAAATQAAVALETTTVGARVVCLGLVFLRIFVEFDEIEVK